MALYPKENDLHRISGQIEKLRFLITVINVFVLLPADHKHTSRNAMSLIFTERKILMVNAFSSFYVRTKTLSIQTFWNWKPHIIADSRKPVYQIDRSADTSWNCSRHPHNHWYMSRLFKHGAFPPQSMITKLFAMIAGVAEDSVLCESKFIHFIKENAQALVQLGDGAVISNEKF